MTDQTNVDPANRTYYPTETTPEREPHGSVHYSVDTEPPYTIYAWNPAAPNPSGEPFWYQPHDLEGNPWSSREAALSFAKAHIAEHFPEATED